MKLFIRFATVAAAVVALAAPARAQQRSVIFSIYGGGADHLADLQKNPSVWFMPGYDLGASVGLQLNEYWAVHTDFTFTRNPTQGSVGVRRDEREPLLLRRARGRPLPAVHRHSRRSCSAAWAPSRSISSVSISSSRSRGRR